MGHSSEHFQIYKFEKRGDSYLVGFFFGHGLGSRGLVRKYRFGEDCSILDGEYDLSWSE